MFKKILIANRGEIACRIMRTAKKMGIHCVAVYSDIEANALHVKLADEAYCIGPAPVRESYLNIPAILDVAKKTKTNAIHPGYGFLAENSEFAKQCEANNLTFIGPSARAIALMGSKSEAKKIMAAAKVPIIPGYHGEAQTLTALTAAAEKIGYPVLFKPTAGGGGKGMRLVKQRSELATALASSKREAQSSFGDDHIIIEKYFPAARHIEVQIFGDPFHNYVYLFERDCSVQRRHQKIIEEAPAPHLTEETRRRLGEAAVAAAKAIQYVNAGTIEFLFADNNFYFMEMNTRLQVEHPVTEMITGQDLVEWQIKIANGERLPLTQEQLTMSGHAIEARIYAENPEKDFLPATGTITFLKEPKQTQYIRIDSGVTINDVVTPYYDPLLAKLIVWDTDRKAAIKKLQQALENYQLVGVTTNINFLQELSKNSQFAAGKIDTQFIDAKQKKLFKKLKLPLEVIVIASLHQLLTQRLATQQVAQTSTDMYSPWYEHNNWRLDNVEPQRLYFSNDTQGIIPRHSRKRGNPSFLHPTESLIQVDATPTTTGYQLQIGTQKIIAGANFNKNGNLDLIIDNQPLIANVVQHEHTLHIFHHGHFVVETHQWASDTLEITTTGTQIIAPMPGTLINMLVKPGQKVTKGEPLLILEAMKMEHTLVAPADGTVKNVFYKTGDQVSEGIQLLEFELTD